MHDEEFHNEANDQFCPICEQALVFITTLKKVKIIEKTVVTKGRKRTVIRKEIIHEPLLECRACPKKYQRQRVFNREQKSVRKLFN